jgi:hypothetical protein
VNRTQDVSISATKVMGRHTAKAGFYLNHSYKAQNLNSNLDFQGLLNFGNDASNPIDTGFPFANAAIGVFSSYGQQSSFIEGSFVYDNVEWYLQDTWRTARGLTLDYGIRFVHQTPQHDRFGQAANFFPERWQPASAPRLYAPACAGAGPCSGDERQARDPVTGRLLGPGTSGLIGQAVPGTGDPANGMLQAGQGIADTGYTWPALGIAPRFGAAYDLRGDQTFVLRGAVGLFFDRPDGNTVFSTVANPPVASGSSQQWGVLQDIGTGRNAFAPVPTVRVYQYDAKLPSDVQWTVGVQRALPFASALDVSYVGHHAFNALGGPQGFGAVDLNAIDLGTTLRAAGQDPTQAGAQPLPDNLLRPYTGYSNILVQWGRFHRTYHSIQTSFTRRWRDSLSAGVNWSWTLSARGTLGLPGAGLRLDHVDGGFRVRDDQAQADALFADQGVLRHLLVANAVWQPKPIPGERRILRLLRRLQGDLQISGILHADSGLPYDIGYSYRTGGGAALTGSPDYYARIVIDGDGGDGCSSNQYAQFDVSRFHGPQPGSVGLESGRGVMHGCPDHRLDVALQRTFRILKKDLVIRMDVFNLFNTLIYTGRQTVAEFESPSDQTLLNAQYLPNGEIDPARRLPSNAGFGAATNAYALRQIRWQFRLKF